MKITKKLIKYWDYDPAYRGGLSIEWSVLERIIRCELSSKTRFQICAVTKLFASFGPASKQKVTWASIEGEIAAWRKHTIKLRQRIGRPSSSSPRQIGRAYVLKGYSEFKLPDDTML